MTDPATAQTLLQQGMYYTESGHLDAAETVLRQAIALDATQATYHFALGNVLFHKGQQQGAEQAYRQAATLQPSMVQAHYNLGVLLAAQCRNAEANAAYSAALAVDAAHAPALHNRAHLWLEQGQVAQAIADFRRAMAANADENHRVLQHSALIFALMFHHDDAQQLLQECRQYAQRYEQPLQAAWQPHSNVADPARRLRVGYVSPNFYGHCQALFTLPVLAQHRHADFEIHCYSSVAAPDAYTEQIRQHADVWHQVNGYSDAQLADKIRADGIDILVDLTMHMRQSRLLVFARKPAPVQIAWLAYPGTTGLQGMDYRISDPYLDPPDMGTPYAEHTLRLPDTFWCYQPFAGEPEVGPLPALANGFITFGNLNSAYKLDDRCLELWAEATRRTPGSRLMLLAPSGGLLEDRLLRRITDQGIAAERLVLVPTVQRPHYMQYYQHIDIGLDSLPYNGHTTSLDSFWMGVPVVSRMGNSVVGRAGWSQLCNLGLPYLCGHTDAQFVDIATTLAADLSGLATLRAGLRARMQQSPLMDAARFTGHLEKLYRQCWLQWCAKVQAAGAPLLPGP